MNGENWKDGKGKTGSVDLRKTTEKNYVERNCIQMEQSREERKERIGDGMNGWGSERMNELEKRQRKDRK